ncbi:MAG: argininosuccinate lyase [Mariprofundaceae bacterium]
MADKPWGGRFEEGTDKLVEDFTASIDIDRRMYAEDIRGSRAHARMLAKQGIISEASFQRIAKGLDEIETEIDQDTFAFLPELEDVHMNIESRLINRIGEDGKKLHTARSRNDQVATDLRLHLRQRIDTLATRIRTLQCVLVKLAEAHAETIMPGFTHLQIAQPITLGHHLLAYVEMLDRDAGRFLDAGKRMNECPLGAAAMAGTTFPVNREMTADELGFDRPCANSIDAVASRDFLLEIIAAASTCAVHLSRLSEELVAWNSQQFGFVELPDAFCTGSSIMPQKKNPDVPELVRGKTGGIIGGLVAMLTIIKGLPLAYNRDLQEDKVVAFAPLDNLEDCLAAFAAMLPGIKVNKKGMYDAASGGFSTATDLADHLVRAGVGFRDAHEIVGKAVAHCVHHGSRLEELTEADCASIDTRLKMAMVASLSVEACVKARNHFGGTAPDQVRSQCLYWHKRMEL